MVMMMVMVFLLNVALYRQRKLSLSAVMVTSDKEEKDTKIIKLDYCRLVGVTLSGQFVISY